MRIEERMEKNTIINEMLEKINAHRSSRGLSPLMLDVSINKICQIHTNNMASGHIPLGHQGFSSRADILLKRLKGTKATENVASGPPDSGQLVRSWLTSDAHRKNIESDCNLTGIACTFTDDGAVYVTQIFIKSIPSSMVSLVPPSIYYDGKGNQVPFLAADELLILVNEHRSDQELNPLKRNEQLDEIAKNYIVEYAGERQAFDHSGFELRAFEAIKKCNGVAYVENIAKGPSDHTAVLEKWMQSPEHAAHLMGDFSQTGLAVGGSDKSGYIYVQLFLGT